MISTFLMNELIADLCKTDMTKDSKWLYEIPSKGYYAYCDEEESRIYDLILTSLMTGRGYITFTSNITPPRMKQLIVYVVKDRRLTVNITEDKVSMKYSDYLDDYGYFYVLEVQSKELFEDIDIYNKLCRLQLEYIMSGVKDEWSDYDKLKYFHDWICENTEYVLRSSNCYNISGVLVDGEATCQAYSKTFNLLCSLAGYDAVEVSGTSVSGAHMWSAVKVNDSWYNFDVTWDDTFNGVDYCWSYFGKPDYIMAKTHEVRKAYKNWVPECTDNYYMWQPWRENMVISEDISDNDLAIFIASRLAAEYKQGEYSILISTIDGEDYRDRLKNVISFVYDILKSNGYNIKRECKFSYLIGGTTLITVEGV